MAEAVYKTGNVVLVDKYAQKTALRLGVAPDAVKLEFKKLVRRKAELPTPENQDQTEVVPTTPPPALELSLLRMLLETDEHVAWLEAHLKPEWLSHPLAREVATRRIELHRSQEWRGIPEFLAQFGKAHEFITDIVMRPLIMNMDGTKFPRSRSLPCVAQQLADVTQRLRSQFIELQATVLMQRMSQPECGDAERLELLHQQQELKRLKRQPL
jgi:hypothetical protein